MTLREEARPPLAAPAAPDAQGPLGRALRDIEPDRKLDPAKQKIAYYHADMMPPPDQPKPVPSDRTAALAAADLVETPEAARAREARGGAPPAHYRPTPPAGAASDAARVKGPFEPATGDAPSPR